MINELHSRVPLINKQVYSVIIQLGSNYILNVSVWNWHYRSYYRMKAHILFCAVHNVHALQFYFALIKEILLRQYCILVFLFQ
jgi:hypothetical protein